MTVKAKWVTIRSQPSNLLHLWNNGMLQLFDHYGCYVLTN